MNQLHESMKKTFNDCLELSRIKNNDYANSENPYKNFETSVDVGVPVERAILVRLMDKITRVSNLLDKEPDVVSESILDSIADGINYLAILKAYLEAGKSENLILEDK